MIAEAEPLEFEEASESKRWWSAMKEEIASIEKNRTWELVELPAEKKPIALKWVYKVKVNPKGKVVNSGKRMVYAPIRHQINFLEWVS